MSFVPSAPCITDQARPCPAASRPVFLTGMRASGKSTLGPLLSEKLGFDFVDLDVFICNEQGRSVGDIVKHGGWPAFRALEADALQRAARASTVVATGGGAVLLGQNRDFMRACGTVIYLNAAPELLWERLQADPKRAQRPSLTTNNPYGSKESSVSGLDEIKALLEERQALYLEAAHLTADASSPLPRLCAQVLAALGRMENAMPTGAGQEKQS